MNVGTGMTDLWGIGKANSKQEHYIWCAIFTASTKRTQKSVISHHLRLINNEPNVLEIYIATKTPGKARSRFQFII